MSRCEVCWSLDHDATADVRHELWVRAEARETRDVAGGPFGRR